MRESEWEQKSRWHTAELVLEVSRSSLQKCLSLATLPFFVKYYFKYLLWQSPTPYPQPPQLLLFCNGSQMTGKYERWVEASSVSFYKHMQPEHPSLPLFFPVREGESLVPAQGFSLCLGPFSPLSLVQCNFDFLFCSSQVSAEVIQDGR